jgi:hypothetical protein
MGMAEFAPAAEHDANKLKPRQASPAGTDGKLEAGASAVAGLDSANLASVGAPNGRPPAPRAQASQLLRMQRSAGNQAVAGLLRRQTRKSVVRPPVAPSNGTLAAPPSSASELVAEPSAQAESGVAEPPVMRSTLVQRDFGDSVLGTVAGWAKEIPGYHLMTLILGKDPISGATVERNATNVVHGILSIVPGGNKTFENLQQSGALDRFFEWVSGEIGKLGLSYDSIKQLFKQAWDALSVTDVFEPSEAWNKVKGIFGPPLGRIKDFALDAGKKVLEFIVEGVLKLAGPLGEQVMALLRKGADIFNKIVEDPIGFLGNLLKAVKGGFEGFMDHIAEHLKNGLMGWLFGALAGAGLTLPKSFDLKGILSLVLQVLGLTYQNLRTKLVAAFGEKTVGYIESAVGFVKTLVTEGLAGAWKMIVEWVGSLKDMVLGAIQDWVITSIVKAAVTKLITMFNPVGAIIQGIITIYNTISFFIERAQQIGAVAASVMDSVGRIAAGDVGGAAQFVEQTMAKAVPVMIGFLASLIGLGGIGNTIRGIIQKIQAPINTALDKLVGFVKGKAMAVIGKLTGKDKQAVAGDAPTGAPIEVPLSMHGAQHQLIYTPGPVPKLEMASNRDLISNKIGKVVAKLKATEVPENERSKKEGQIAMAIEVGRRAKDLQTGLLGTTSKPKPEGQSAREYNPAGFAELKQEIENYGNAYQATDLDDVLVEPADVKATVAARLYKANHVPPVSYSRAKHWRGNSEAERRDSSRNGGPGQFTYRLSAADVKALEREAFLTGELENRGGGRFFAFKQFSQVIGYDSGNDAHWLRAEMTPQNDIHSHPRESR